MGRISLERKQTDVHPGLRDMHELGYACGLSLYRLWFRLQCLATPGSQQMHDERWKNRMWLMLPCFHEWMKSKHTLCPPNREESRAADIVVPERIYWSWRVAETMSKFGSWWSLSPVSRHAMASSRCVRDLFGVGEAYFCLHLLSTLLSHILLWDVKSSACAGCAVREKSKQASGGLSATWPRQIVTRLCPWFVPPYLSSFPALFLIPESPHLHISS